MAPEQVRGAATVDERSDIYAIGSVVFRCLVGKLPFDGITANMLVSSKLEGEPPPLAKATGEQWPASIEAFVAKCLAKQREDRYSSASAALTALRAVMTKYAAVTGARPPRPASPPETGAASSESEYPPAPDHTVADS